MAAGCALPVLLGGIPSGLAAIWLVEGFFVPLVGALFSLLCLYACWKLCRVLATPRPKFRGILEPVRGKLTLQWWEGEKLTRETRLGEAPYNDFRFSIRPLRTESFHHHSQTVYQILVSFADQIEPLRHYFRTQDEAAAFVERLDAAYEKRAPMIDP